MRKLLISAVLSTLMAACGDREPEVPAVDIEAGRAVVQANCTGCHSLEGAGKTAEIPNLAAQPADYLVEAMLHRPDQRIEGRHGELRGAGEDDDGLAVGGHERPEACRPPRGSWPACVASGVSWSPCGV